jgi:hypothetical protein
MHHLISCRHFWMGRRCTMCCSCCISTYCRLASFCWLSSLWRQSCFFLILVCLGWRHYCCCCCTCAILVLCRPMWLLLVCVIIVQVVVVILAIWKTHTLLCSLTRLFFRFPWVSFLSAFCLPFCFLVVRSTSSDWRRSEVATCSFWRSEG